MQEGFDLTPRPFKMLPSSKSLYEPDNLCYFLASSFAAYGSVHMTQK